MQTSTTPIHVSSPATDNLNTLIDERLAKPDDTIIEIRKPDGSGWTPVTVAQFAEQVREVAKGFIAIGVQPGDRIGIMARTSYEWCLLDFAIWAAGAVTVPVYETSSAKQLSWIVSDAGVKVIVVEAEAHAQVVKSARKKLPNLEQVFVLSSGAISDLTNRGDGIGDAELERRRRHAQCDDLATIIYTSGTTGNPKGAMLTHRNFLDTARNATLEIPEVVGVPGTRTLMFLPLAHVFARLIQVLAIQSETVIGHTPDTATLVEDLGTFKPTFLLAVPRVFEKVYNSAEQKAALGGKVKIFRWAARVGIAWSRAHEGGGKPGFMLNVYHKIADKLVLSKIRKLLGEQAKWAVSGGAALGERLGHFYRALGFTVLEGYGLTETTAPTSVNRPRLSKIGSVGLPMPGTHARVAEDGEIELKGYHIFVGYNNNEEATAAAMTEDGWYRTGDLGRIDEDGYLWITGRKKEIIVTAGGKNVAPAVLEDRLRSHPAISQVVVVGDARPYIGALITLDPEGVPGWLKTHGQPEMTLLEAASNEALTESIQKAVDRANKAVSQAESIRKWRIIDTDFTEDNGYLTPSLKVKRAKVLVDFESEVDALYGGPVAKEE